MITEACWRRDKVRCIGGGNDSSWIRMEWEGSDIHTQYQFNINGKKITSKGGRDNFSIWPFPEASQTNLKWERGPNKDQWSNLQTISILWCSMTYKTPTFQSIIFIHQEVSSHLLTKWIPFSPGWQFSLLSPSPDSSSGASDRLESWQRLCCKPRPQGIK